MLQVTGTLQRCAALTLELERYLSRFPVKKALTFYHKDLSIIETPPNERRALPKEDERLPFGVLFSDHMLDVDWSVERGWSKPFIRPYGDLSLSPSAKVLHYACEAFEGLKAYRGVDGSIRLFRPQLNMARMRKSAHRAALPDFDGDELLKCIKELVRLDQAWVPHKKAASLYIRPTIIGTDPQLGVGTSKQAKLFVITSPVGAYFDTLSPVSLLADPAYIRSAKGGVGSFKMGCNYAPTIYVGERAAEKGCQQVLWLSGPEHHVTEVGAMNVFMYWKNENGDDELITPSLENGLILPGITRQSILDLSKEMGGFKVSERDFTMDDVKKALDENRVYEFFGSGTAVVVTPIDRVLYITEGKEENLRFPVPNPDKSLMQRLFNALNDIYYGRVLRTQWTTEV